LKPTGEKYRLKARKEEGPSLKFFSPSLSEA
jgi:hypothetical protein